MPGLIRGVARTAVVAGTATAVSGRVRRRQEGRWAAQEQQQYAQYEQQQAYQQQQQQAYAPPPAAPAAPQVDVYAELKKLGELRDAGILSDTEFEVEKAKILRG
jgi:hypothetical protein